MSPDAEIPDFDGPWAASFTRTYKASTSELQRSVLEDGTITEFELRTIEDELRACYINAGMSGIEFHDGGGGAMRPPPGMDGGSEEFTQLIKSCDVAVDGGDGGIRMLYWQMQASPANDANGAIVACLIDKGMVEPGYTVEQFLRDSELGTLPFPIDDATFGACLAGQGTG